MTAHGRFHRPGHVIFTPLAGVCFGLPDVDGPFVAGGEVTVALPLRLELTAHAHGSWSGSTFRHLWREVALGHAVAGASPGSRVMALIVAADAGTDGALLLGLRGTGAPDVGPGSASGPVARLDVRVGVSAGRAGPRRAVALIGFGLTIPIELSMRRR